MPFENGYTFENVNLRSFTPWTSPAMTSSEGFLLHRAQTLTSPSDRRPMPQGIERLFNPTTRSMYRSTRQDCIIKRKSDYYGTKGWYEQAAFWTWDYPPSSAPFVETPPSNSDLLLKIKSQKVNLAMALAEYRQTADMFKDCAHQVVDIIRDIRRGRFLHLLKQGVRKSPNTWLMYRYGISPLISDVQGLVEEFQAGGDRPLIVSVRVSHNKNGTLQWGDSPLAEYPGKIHIGYNNSYKDIAWIQYDNSTLSTFNRLGLTNLPQLAWEVIPFSFVVDWFLNIGDTLSSLDALTGVSRVSATRTNRLNSKWIYPNGQIGTYKSYYRSPLSLSVQAPRWEPSLTWKRLTDACALVRQAFH